MEQAIVDAYLKTIQEMNRKHNEQLEQESRKFVAALQAVRGVAFSTDTSAVYRLQNSINGLSEDVGDLDKRLSAIEKGNEDPWLFGGADGFMSDSVENEVIAEPYEYVPVSTVKEVRLTPVPEPLPIANATADAVATTATAVASPVTEVVTATTVAVTSETKPTLPEPTPTPTPSPEEDQEEEEEEALEPFEFEGQEYYKDADNNVYTANEEGEVSEAAVGRWIEKRQKIKFYSTA
jgi:hypothetical protein